jgi:hypothetical protein
MQHPPNTTSWAREETLICNRTLLSDVTLLNFLKNQKKLRDTYYIVYYPSVSFIKKVEIFWPAKKDK